MLTYTYTHTLRTLTQSYTLAHMLTHSHTYTSHSNTIIHSHTLIHIHTYSHAHIIIYTLFIHTVPKPSVAAQRFTSSFPGHHSHEQWSSQLLRPFSDLDLESLT